MRRLALIAACLALAWPAASAERPFGGLAKLPNNVVITAGRVDIKPESPLLATGAGGLIVGTAQEYVITNGAVTCTGGCTIAAPMNVTVAVFLRIGTVYRQVVPTFRTSISDAVLTEITLQDLYQSAHSAVTVDADVLREGDNANLLGSGQATVGQALLADGGGATEWGAAASGDIEGVTAGDGLTGGGTTGAVTVSLASPMVLAETGVDPAAPITSTATSTGASTGPLMGGVFYAKPNHTGTNPNNAYGLWAATVAQHNSPAVLNIAEGVNALVHHDGSGTTNYVYGSYNEVDNAGTGTIGSAHVVRAIGGMTNIGTAGDFALFHGTFMEGVDEGDPTTSTVGTVYGLRLDAWNKMGTVNNSYGIFMDSSIDLGGVNKYAIYSTSTSPSVLSGSLSVPSLDIDVTSAAAGNVYPLTVTSTVTGDLTGTAAGTFESIVDVSGTNPTSIDAIQGVTTTNHDAPAALALVGGAHLLAKHNGSGSIQGVYGVYSEVDNSGPGSIDIAVADKAFIYGTGGGTITSASLFSGSLYQSNATNTVGTVYGLRLNSWIHSGTVNNSYGIYMDSSIDAGSVTKYALFSSSASPSYMLGPLTLGGASPLVFDGATAGTNTATFAVTDPTGNNIITVPDASGTLALTSGVEPAVGRHVTVATVGGDFQSVGAAMAYVGAQGAAFTTPWTIEVYPGMYTEAPFSWPSGVALVGVSGLSNGFAVEAPTINSTSLTSGAWITLLSDAGFAGYNISQMSNVRMFLTQSAAATGAVYGLDGGALAHSFMTMTQVRFEMANGATGQTLAFWRGGTGADLLAIKNSQAFASGSSALTTFFDFNTGSGEGIVFEASRTSGGALTTFSSGGTFSLYYSYLSNYSGYAKHVTTSNPITVTTFSSNLDLTKCGPGTVTLASLDAEPTVAVRRLMVANGAKWTATSAPTTDDSTSDVIVAASSATQTPVAVQGVAGQSAPLFKAQNSAGATVALISSTGAISGSSFTLPYYGLDYGGNALTAGYTWLGPVQAQSYIGGGELSGVFSNIGGGYTGGGSGATISSAGVIQANGNITSDATVQGATVTATTAAIIPSGAAPAATCTVGSIFIDTDQTDDTNCATTADNSLCICTATDTWAALENN